MKFLKVMWWLLFFTLAGYLGLALLGSDARRLPIAEMGQMWDLRVSIPVAASISGVFLALWIGTAAWAGYTGRRQVAIGAMLYCMYPAFGTLAIALPVVGLVFLALFFSWYGPVFSMGALLGRVMGIDGGPVIFIGSLVLPALFLGTYFIARRVGRRPRKPAHPVLPEEAGAGAR